MRKIEPQIAFTIIMIAAVGFLWFFSVQSANLTEDLEKMDNEMIRRKGAVITNLTDKKNLSDFSVGNVSDELVSTVAWKIYLNEKYGYSMMYPKNWNYEESSSRKSVVFYSVENDYKKNNSREVLKINKYRELDINRYINEYKIYDDYSEVEDIEIISISNIKLNFLTAKRIQLGNGNEINREVTFVDGMDNSSFILTREEVVHNKEIINTIISTFRINEK